MLNSDALTYEVSTRRALNAVAAGITNQNGAIIDMSGYDGIRAIAMFGTVTTTHTTGLKFQQDDAVGMGSAADITGSATTALIDAGSNKMLISDVIQPRKRYVRCVVTRGVANAVIDGVVYELYKARVRPIPQDSTVDQQTIVVPTA